MKDDTSLARLILRTFPLGEYIEQATFTLNHDVTYVGSGPRNERDTTSTPARLSGHGAYTLSTDARLTKPATCHPQGTGLAISAFKRQPLVCPSMPHRALRVWVAHAHGDAAQPRRPTYLTLHPEARG